MNVLIIEDDQFKFKQLSSFVKEAFPLCTILSARSVHSGKIEIRARSFDIVLLDMSLPSYDIGGEEPGGRPQAFGGRELLGYMDFLELATPVIVVTQFERFDTGDDEIEIETLGETLKESYPGNFRGIIYYNAASEQWKHMLIDAMISVGG
ncbi:hypothetical protein [Hyalangium minutum]|uniref:hypothetical protein n=1 Tax=Hyalangium minutum TaxID=394096 RepID=UPI00094B310E|nr:hypothetical protein [Hyalangium minutum]